MNQPEQSLQLHVRLRDTIQRLYLLADLTAPSLQYPVAPLGPILERRQLRCIELTPLHSRAAEALLWQKRALASSEGIGDTNTEPLAGFLFASGDAGYILVCSSCPVTRRRFSVAHELGHFLLHYLPLLSQPASEEVITEWTDAFRVHEANRAEEGKTQPIGSRVLEATGANDNPAMGEADYAPHAGRMPTQTSGPLSGTQPARVTVTAATFVQQEREANQFAAELLMPATVVRDLHRKWRTHVGADLLTERLATLLLVSKAAMRVRLQQLQEGSEAWD